MMLFEPLYNFYFLFTVFPLLRFETGISFAAFSYKSSSVVLIPTNENSVLTTICFQVPFLLLSNISSSSNIHKGKAIDS